MEKKTELTGTAHRSPTRAVAVRRKITTRPSSGAPAESIRCLQNLGGNQAVQQWVKSGTLQAKLTIGPPNDIYEQEAERVADQVMRMSEPSVSGQRSAADAVQRKPG